VEQPAHPSNIGTYTVSGSYAQERGASVVPLGSSTTTVSLAAN
jgi:hypothetical protein